MNRVLVRLLGMALILVAIRDGATSPVPGAGAPEPRRHPAIVAMLMGMGPAFVFGRHDAGAEDVHV